MTETNTTQSMAAFVDALLMQGITWTNLEARCKEESAKRGVTTLSTMGAIKSHVRYRSTQTKLYSVNTDDKGARMRVLPKPAKEVKAVAKKTGRATGKRVAKTTNGNRQTVTEQPAPEQTPAT